LEAIRSPVALGLSVFGVFRGSFSVKFAGFSCKKRGSMVQ
jgi:hypothetical protein